MLPDRSSMSDLSLDRRTFSQCAFHEASPCCAPFSKSSSAACEPRHNPSNFDAELDLEKRLLEAALQRLAMSLVAPPSASKEYPSLLFTPRSGDLKGQPDFRTPRAARSPSSGVFLLQKAVLLFLHGHFLPSESFNKYPHCSGTRLRPNIKFSWDFVKLNSKAFFMWSLDQPPD